MYQENGIRDAGLLQYNRPQKSGRELGPTLTQGPFLGYTIQTGVCREIHVLNYIKKLSTYMSDLAATFLGFAHDE